MSKQLDSILKGFPSATINDEAKKITQKNDDFREPRSLKIECNEKISARIPVKLKDEIRDYIRNNKGETEQTVIFKALRLMGFKIDQSLLIDKRTIR